MIITISNDRICSTHSLVSRFLIRVFFSVSNVTSDGNHVQFPLCDLGFSHRDPFLQRISSALDIGRLQLFDLGSSGGEVRFVDVRNGLITLSSRLLNGQELSSSSRGVVNRIAELRGELDELSTSIC